MARILLWRRAVLGPWKATVRPVSLESDSSASQLFLRSSAEVSAHTYAWFSVVGPFFTSMDSIISSRIENGNRKRMVTGWRMHAVLVTRAGKKGGSDWALHED